MMFCKVLAIFAFCALTVAFPSLDIDLINEELQDSDQDLLNSTTDQTESTEEGSLEDGTDIDSTTVLMQTTDLMPNSSLNHGNTQISVSSTDAETILSSFVEETIESSGDYNSSQTESMLDLDFDLMRPSPGNRDLKTQ